jgi:hypothetical protein
VVAFVAGVLVEVVLRRHPRVLARPRAIPRRRIFDSEAVDERIRVRAPDALDDVELIARSVELRLGCEVRGIDDQCVAFPPADRVPHPVADGRRQMFAADTNHARVVHHLIQDHD